MIWLVLCRKLMPSCNVVPPLKKASQKCHVFFTQRRKFPKLQMECDWWARTLFLLLSKLLFFLFRKKRRPSLLLEEDICSVTPFLSPYFRETSPQLYDIVHVYISNARAPLYTFLGGKAAKNLCIHRPLPRHKFTAHNFGCLANPIFEGKIKVWKFINLLGPRGLKSLCSRKVEWEAWEKLCS